MTRSAVLPGAAPRATRTVAGRRVLHLVLLVGAVFVLGVLCGERAQAVDGGPVRASSGPPPLSSAVPSPASSSAPSSPSSAAGVAVPVVDGARAGVSAAAGRPGGPGAASVERSADSDERSAAPGSDPAPDPRPDPVRPDPVRPVQPRPAKPHPAEDLPEDIPPGTARPTGEGEGKGIVRAVGERVVTPAVDRPGGIVAGLAAAPGKALPAPPLPSLPALPGLSWPGVSQPAPLPELPVLPDLPVAPGFPGPSDLLPVTLPAPLTFDPPKGTGASRQAAPAPQPKPKPEPGASVSPDAGRPGAAEAAPHGPHHKGAGTGTEAYATWSHDGADDRGDARTVPHTEPAAPAPHAPGESPDGTTGNRTAADHGTPRHGDTPAVTVSHRPRLLLAPGVAAQAEAAETRDRYRDVPVSPA
ncbi:hypothetical protein [Streptomyces sp. NPDC058625]|uniref:hypothetical protein n=1 Tax=Streptomyces sp. NPDC058625 TaxID=3346564 RepID=UPI0036633DC3